MPITNLNNAHLTDEQKQAINNAVKALETALEPLQINLKPEERRKYGSVNEQHKLLINKVRDYHLTKANLSDPDNNWEEFEKDFQSRTFLEGIITSLSEMQQRMENAKILHDYDNYQAALDDYSYTSYRAGGNKPGYETKMNELKQFFTRTKPTGENNEPSK